MQIAIKRKLLTSVTPISLYEQDLLLWTEETIRHLKAKNFDELDLDNLIEEIEALGRSAQKEKNSQAVFWFSLNIS